MVEMADLHHRDLVVDPACGTGRFLIWSMIDMVAKLRTSDERDKEAEEERIRMHRLFGADIDGRIAKTAKMNMWIHGDGKANIFGGPEYNGLTLRKHGFDGHESFDGVFDVVLTNPPLGELNCQGIEFVDGLPHDAPDDTLARMPVLPHKNQVADRLATIEERLGGHKREQQELLRRAGELESQGSVIEWREPSDSAETAEQRLRRRKLRSSPCVQEYQGVRSALARKESVIKRNEEEAEELRIDLRRGSSRWEITGNTMKGGGALPGSHMALFEGRVASG